MFYASLLSHSCGTLDWLPVVECEVTEGSESFPRNEEAIQPEIWARVDIPYSFTGCS